MGGGVDVDVDEVDGSVEDVAVVDDDDGGGGGNRDK